MMAFSELPRRAWAAAKVYRDESRTSGLDRVRADRVLNVARARPLVARSWGSAHDEGLGGAGLAVDPLEAWRSDAEFEC